MRKNRVLVLAGGGAKGAYAFGCLKAFKELGLEFSAVIGTSVGGINAVLWSSAAFEQGERLWRNLSFASVYPVKFVNPSRHHPTVIRVLAFSFVVLRLIWAAFHKWPIPGASFICTLAAAVAASPVLLLLATSSYSHWVVWGVFVAFAFLLRSSLAAGTDGGQITFAAGAVNILWMSVAFSYLDDIRSLGTFLGVVVSATMIVAAGTLYFVMYCAFQYVARNDASVLSSMPLRDQIATIVREHPLSIATVITVAREVSIFDPDDPVWSTRDPGDGSGRPSQSATWYPDMRRTWCPAYIRIDQTSPEAAAIWCAASAALPFGIVPSLILESGTYVDGGLVDNCPLTPVLYGAGYDEVFVVLLQPFKNDVDAIVGGALSEELCARRIRLMNLIGVSAPAECQWDDRPYKIQNDPPTVVPLPAATCKPEMLLFYPKTSLGGFMSGTLNFDGRYAATLMDLGYRDTIAKLKDYPQAIVAPSPASDGSVTISNGVGAG